MSRFIETVNISKGLALNIDFHNERLNVTRKRHYSDYQSLDLNNYLPNPGQLDQQKVYRCTFYYDRDISDIKIIEYQKPMIKSLKIIEANHIEYAYKYADRSSLDQLYDFREGQDDIVIMKNGLLTDGRFANLVFFDGNSWFTPSKPLLHGTKRKKLLEKGFISEKEIGIRDIGNYRKCTLINAMLDIGDCEVETHEIV